ncbi:MAG: hypothetical protein JNM81_16795, partial [Rhodospirillaceae bacterium]|nr:hypothetical protein [Rhodospirillaceae bacterium]
MLAPLVAACGVVLAILLWRTLHAAQESNVKAILDTRLDAYTKLADARLDAVEDALVRTGRRWAVLQRTPRLAWASDAQGLLKDYPELE